MNYIVRRSRRNLFHKKKSGKRYRNRSRRQRGGSKEMKRYYNVYFNYLYDDRNGDRNEEILTRQITAPELENFQEAIEMTVDIITDDTEPGFNEHLVVQNLTQLEQPRNNKHFNLQLYTINKSREESLRLINHLMLISGQMPVPEDIDWSEPEYIGGIEHRYRYYLSYEPENVDIVERDITGGFYKSNISFISY